MDVGKGGALSSSAAHKPDQKNRAKTNKHNMVQVINIQQGRYGSILDAKKAQISLQVAALSEASQKVFSVSSK